MTEDDRRFFEIWRPRVLDGSYRHRMTTDDARRFIEIAARAVEKAREVEGSD